MKSSSSRLVSDGNPALRYGTATPSIEQELWAPLSAVARAQGRDAHRTRMNLAAATGFLIVVLAALMITVPIEYEIEQQSGLSSATSLSTAEIVPPGQPREIHIALYDVSSSFNVSSEVNPAVGVTISWATANSTRTSTVRFGTDATKLTSVTQAQLPCVQYDFCSYTSPCIHHVTLEGLTLLPRTTYYCKSLSVIVNHACKADALDNQISVEMKCPDGALCERSTASLPSEA